MFIKDYAHVFTLSKIFEIPKNISTKTVLILESCILNILYALITYFNLYLNIIYLKKKIINDSIDFFYDVWFSGKIGLKQDGQFIIQFIVMSIIYKFKITSSMLPTTLTYRFSFVDVQYYYNRCYSRALWCSLTARQRQT